MIIETPSVHKNDQITVCYEYCLCIKFNCMPQFFFLYVLAKYYRCERLCIFFCYMFHCSNVLINVPKNFFVMVTPTTVIQTLVVMTCVHCCNNRILA